MNIQKIAIAKLKAAEYNPRIELKAGDKSNGNRGRRGESRNARIQARPQRRGGLFNRRVGYPAETNGKGLQGRQHRERHNF